MGTKSYSELLEMEDLQGGPNGVLTIYLHGVEDLLKSQYTCDSATLIALVTVAGHGEWSQPAVLSDGGARWGKTMRFSMTAMLGMKHHPYNMVNVTVYSCGGSDIGIPPRHSSGTDSLQTIGEVFYHVFDIIDNTTALGGAVVSNQLCQGNHEVGNVKLGLSFASGEFGFRVRHAEMRRRARGFPVSLTDREQRRECGEAAAGGSSPCTQPLAETDRQCLDPAARTASSLLEKLYAAAAPPGNEFKAVRAANTRLAAFSKEYDRLGSRVERIAYLTLTTRAEGPASERGHGAASGAPSEDDPVEPYEIPKWLQKTTAVPAHPRQRRESSLY